jgi:hypothetical protein
LTGKLGVGASAPVFLTTRTYPGVTILAFLLAAIPFQPKAVLTITLDFTINTDNSHVPESRHCTEVLLGLNIRHLTQVNFFTASSTTIPWSLTRKKLDKIGAPTHPLTTTLKTKRNRLYERPAVGSVDLGSWRPLLPPRINHGRRRDRYGPASGPGKHSNPVKWAPR